RADRRPRAGSRHEGLRARHGATRLGPGHSRGMLHRPPPRRDPEPAWVEGYTRTLPALPARLSPRPAMRPGPLVASRLRDDIRLELAIQKEATPASAAEGQRQREYVGGTGRAERAGGQRQCPAGADEVVDEQDPPGSAAL